MKQVLHHLRDGKLELADIPYPQNQTGHALIRSTCSLISAGTERMLLDFSRAGFLEKARQQPERVAQVMDKMRTDGMASTIETVRAKLDTPLALGYCNVGRVLEIGTGVGGFAPGDRVASNGRHAEVVAVPVNLCAKVPDGVTDDEAVFTPLAAIALQGIRLANPSLGETVAVTGLGVIGLLAVQLLRAHGCRVIGFDFDQAKLELARSFGAEVVDLSAGRDPVEAAMGYSRRNGVDAVVITAATNSSEPVHQAAQMSRKRGRIVLVGVTGLELRRSDFYEKELTFQVSCSYGPGRYDQAYEERGQDYPLGFVRWTEQRNFQAVLDMMADRRLDVAPLISHRFPVERAQESYALLTDSTDALGILLEYPGGDAVSDSKLKTANVRLKPVHAKHEGEIAVSFIGAGSYASRTLMPAFKAAGVRLRSAASNGGVGSFHAGRRHGFEQVTTDVEAVMNDPDADALVIATRHDSHARLVVDALRAGKHVFVEKPLCLTLEELRSIAEVYRSLPSPPLLMVGFNRRFSPHVQKVRDLLVSVQEPKSFIMTINAGAIPPDHWTHDADIGGGRVIGEACHFIDLLRHLSGHPIIEWRHLRADLSTGDTTSILLAFGDGSIGTVHYFANGHRRFPKERLEVFCGGRVLQLDNFRILRGFGWPGFRTMRLWRQDKGQQHCVAAFVDSIKNGSGSPIALDELLEVSRVTLELGSKG